MPDLNSWLTNPKVYKYLNTKQGKTLKDYLDDNFPLKEAACKLIRYYDLELYYDQSFQKVMDILF